MLLPLLWKPFEASATCRAGGRGSCPQSSHPDLICAPKERESRPPAVALRNSTPVGFAQRSGAGQPVDRRLLGGFSGTGFGAVEGALRTALFGLLPRQWRVQGSERPSMPLRRSEVHLGSSYPCAVRREPMSAGCHGLPINLHYSFPNYFLLASHSSPLSEITPRLPPMLP